MGALDVADIQSFLKKGDENIKCGRTDKVRHEFQSLSCKSIPDEYRLEFAKLARRCGLHQLQSEILRPLIIHSKNHRRAHDAEVAEYCMGLIRLGALGEAKLRLAELNTSQCPEALNAEMQLAISLYDHKKAIEAATNLVAQNEMPPYEKALIQINLIAAQIGDRQFELAKDHLLRLNAVLVRQEWHLLLSHCYQLCAQVCIRQEHYDEATDYLELADSMNSDTENRYSLFIKRWKATIEANKSGSLEPLNLLSMAAADHPATLRGIDYEKLLIRFDRETYCRLYFGSPYLMYRKILEEKFEMAPNRFEWNPSGQARGQLDLTSGMWNGQKIFSSDHQVGHLMTVIFSDFYGPIDLGRIFEALYPEEHYLGKSSDDRIRQAVSRLNQFAKKQEMPFQLHKKGVHYALEYSGPMSVQMEKEQGGYKYQFSHRVLSSQFGSQPFSAKAAQECLNVSRSTALRVLSHLCAKGELMQQGFGVHTIYQLVSDKPSCDKNE